MDSKISGISKEPNQPLNNARNGQNDLNLNALGQPAVQSQKHKQIKHILNFLPQEQLANMNESDNHAIHQLRQIFRTKRSYIQVESNKRDELIRLVSQSNCTIKKAAQQLGINYSTAKHIVKQTKSGTDVNEMKDYSIKSVNQQKRNHEKQESSQQIKQQLQHEQIQEQLQQVDKPQESKNSPLMDQRQVTLIINQPHKNEKILDSLDRQRVSKSADSIDNNLRLTINFKDSQKQLPIKELNDKITLPKIPFIANQQKEGAQINLKSIKNDKALRQKLNLDNNQVDRIQEVNPMLEQRQNESNSQTQPETAIMMKQIRSASVVNQNAGIKIIPSLEGSNSFCKQFQLSNKKQWPELITANAVNGAQSYFMNQQASKQQVSTHIGQFQVPLTKNDYQQIYSPAAESMQYKPNKLETFAILQKNSKNLFTFSNNNNQPKDKSITGASVDEKLQNLKEYVGQKRTHYQMDPLKNLQNNFKIQKLSDVDQTSLKFTSRFNRQQSNNEGRQKNQCDEISASDLNILLQKQQRINTVINTSRGQSQVNFDNLKISHEMVVKKKTMEINQEMLKNMHFSNERSSKTPVVLKRITHQPVQNVIMLNRDNNQNQENTKQLTQDDNEQTMREESLMNKPQMQKTYSLDLPSRARDIQCISSVSSKENENVVLTNNIASSRVESSVKLPYLQQIQKQQNKHLSFQTMAFSDSNKVKTIFNKENLIYKSELKQSQFLDAKKSQQMTAFQKNDLEICESSSKNSMSDTLSVPNSNSNYVYKSQNNKLLLKNPNNHIKEANNQFTEYNCTKKQSSTISQEAIHKNIIEPNNFQIQKIKKDPTMKNLLNITQGQNNSYSFQPDNISLLSTVIMNESKESDVEGELNEVFNLLKSRNITSFPNNQDSNANKISEADERELNWLILKLKQIKHVAKLKLLYMLHKKGLSYNPFKESSLMNSIGNNKVESLQGNEVNLNQQQQEGQINRNQLYQQQQNQGVMPVNQGIQYMQKNLSCILLNKQVEQFQTQPINITQVNYPSAVIKGNSKNFSQYVQNFAVQQPLGNRTNNPNSYQMKTSQQFQIGEPSPIRNKSNNSDKSLSQIQQDMASKQQRQGIHNAFVQIVQVDKNNNAVMQGKNSASQLGQLSSTSGLQNMKTFVPMMRKHSTSKSNLIMVKKNSSVLQNNYEQPLLQNHARTNNIYMNKQLVQSQLKVLNGSNLKKKENQMDNSSEIKNQIDTLYDQIQISHDKQQLQALLKSEIEGGTQGSERNNDVINNLLYKLQNLSTQGQKTHFELLNVMKQSNPLQQQFILSNSSSMKPILQQFHQIISQNETVPQTAVPSNVLQNQISNVNLNNPKFQLVKQIQQLDAQAQQLNAKPVGQDDQFKNLISQSIQKHFDPSERGRDLVNVEGTQPMYAQMNPSEQPEIGQQSNMHKLHFVNQQKIYGAQDQQSRYTQFNQQGMQNNINSPQLWNYDQNLNINNTQQQNQELNQSSQIEKLLQGQELYHYIGQHQQPHKSNQQQLQANQAQQNFVYGNNQLNILPQVDQLVNTNNGVAPQQHHDIHSHMKSINQLLIQQNIQLQLKRNSICVPAINGGVVGLAGALGGGNGSGVLPNIGNI